MRKIILLVFAFAILGASFSAIQNDQPQLIALAEVNHAPKTSSAIYLPFVRSQSNPTVTSARRVNAPYFNDEIQFPEMAIFWFGRVTSTENYADVRIGYNDTALVVYVAIFDRWLWYNTLASGSLTDWDSVTLYLNLDGNTGNAPGVNSFRFDSQLNWWESRNAYQSAYRGNGTTWTSVPIAFTTTAAWRGNGLNANVENRGWATCFTIPFPSLGLATPPPSSSKWGMALVVHDRDDSIGTPIADKIWPETLLSSIPATWGQVGFGLPSYMPASASAGATVKIRHGLNNVIVPDAGVGGTTPNLCPGDSSYIWNQWGNDNFGDQPDWSVQNQSDVGDWPCFAKYYVTFPLNLLPTGQVILSATLILHQFGQAGAVGEAVPSLVQVMTVSDDWDVMTIAWNNAPIALENVSRAWVGVIGSCQWPCVPRTWDLSLAVAQAYAAGKPLRLVLYQADDSYHSGKYFVSSDTGEWNANGRPTLDVLLGNPN